MNRITCSVCGETALTSPLPAEKLEGLGVTCVHCSAFGRVSLQEAEDDCHTLAALVLIVRLCEHCTSGPVGACDCEDPAYQEAMAR